jgi:hypothetical protein
MAKIFLTGMSAPQASEKSNSRSLNFAGVVYKVLVEAGHDVTWGDPDISLTKKDMNEYDCILLGVSPLTSLAANRIYGALKLINTLDGDNRLRLFLDTPNVKQVSIGINSAMSNPESLTKPFYSYRKDYKIVVSDSSERELVLDGLRKLHETKWPVALFPSLPWTSTDGISSNLPENIGNSLIGINLDSYLLEDSSPVNAKINQWAHEVTGSTAEKKLLKTLTIPTTTILSGRAYSDVTAYDQLFDCQLAFIAPVKNDGSWWSYRYVQAIASGSVVYTDWKETQAIGESWGYLATTIECLSYDEKRRLAAEQKAAYKNAIPNRGVALRSLEIALGIFKGKET